jgi:hypothetical protein
MKRKPITKAEAIDSLLKISSRMEYLTDTRPVSSQEHQLYTRRLAARDLAQALLTAMEDGNTTELDRWIATY